MRSVALALISAVGIAVAGVAFGWTHGGPATARAESSELRPDLITKRPDQIFLQVTKDGRRLVRLSNEVVNAGAGPLELRPRRDDCNRDGNVRNDRTMYQRIFADVNGDRRFSRPVDKRYRTIRAGCSFYHPQHKHWHFESFAAYAVYATRPDGSLGTLVRGGTKVTGCLGDSRHRLRELPGSPRRRYYGRVHRCRRDSIGGISIGWGDLYDARTSGQEVDVTGLPQGVYCVVSQADPANRVVESNEGNNARSTRFVLGTESLTWRPYRPCS